MPQQSTPRARILAALDRRPTDVLPFDIGGTKVTSLNVSAYRNLVEALGFGGPTEIAHWRSQRTHMTEEVSAFFGSDVRRVRVPYPEPIPEGIRSPVQLDEWGTQWTQSADTGLYFVSRSPLAGEVSAHDVRSHSWPDPVSLMPVERVAASARQLRASTDCAICLDLPDGVTHLSQFLRGFDDWLLDVATNRALLGLIMDHVVDVYCAMVGPLLDAVGDHVDVVLHCDDIAGQGGPLISPRAYRELIKPRQARIFATIKAHTRARLLYHSCGGVAWAIGDLVEIGADALNPVQVSAAGMDSAALARGWGDKIAFWGGIDTHHALPFGSPDDVRAEVARRINDMRGASYIAGSVHIVQAEVPPANLLAMAWAAHVYGGRAGGAQFDRALDRIARREVGQAAP
jgi:uroporphyrinogen decarboxylase